MWSDRFSAMATAACTCRQSVAARKTLAAAILFLCLFSVSPSGGAISLVMLEDVENATLELGNRFEKIRTKLLGADALAAEYNRVGFEYSSLDVSNYLSGDFAASAINKALDIVFSINPSSSSTTNIPSDCCEASSLSEVCCDSCEGSSGALLSAIADAFSSEPSLMDLRAELEFGHVNGSLLRYPSPAQSAADCTPQLSNLQPWYNSIIRASGLEVVLILDLNDLFDVKMDTEGLRAAATTVLDSLTIGDKVTVLLVGMNVVSFIDESGSSKVVPVCPGTLQQLKQFIAEDAPATTRERPASYIDAFATAFNAFEPEPSDKLILFFTSASNEFVLNNNINDNTFFQSIIDNVTRFNSQADAVISVYYNHPLLAQNAVRFRQLAESQPIPGIAVELTTENDVRSYYDPLNPVGDFLTRHVGRDVNSRGDSSFSVLLALISGFDLVGVFRVLLPWEMLFPLVDDSLKSGDGNSYLFVTNEQGYVLYHPLLPGDFQSGVSVADLESPAVLSKMVSGESEFVVSATKTAVISASVHGEDANAFIDRSVNVTYTCRSHDIHAIVNLFECVAVTKEGEVTAQLKDADIQKLYKGNSDRLPLYHTSEIPRSDQCFDFCEISSEDQLSVQLTGLSTPPADVGLTQINDLLTGSIGSTSWAEESVANELGVASVVRKVWRDSESGGVISDYVIRRHLATPSGLYLAYPFIHLSSDFLPTRTEWYAFSSAHRRTLTLTPPRPDTLWGVDHIVSAGYALFTPPQDRSGGDGGDLLAVVAADLTFLTLKALVEDAMPLCRNKNYDCFLLDDQGNLLYHELLLTEEYEDLLEEPIFLAALTLPASIEAKVLRHVLVSVLNTLMAVKLRCIDYLNKNVRQRLYINFDLDNYEAHVVSIEGFEYVIQMIPGTNAFFGIAKRIQTSIPVLCFCSKNCQTCENNESGGCECPCKCPEDCTIAHIFPACPATSPGGDQLARGTPTIPALTNEDTAAAQYCFPLDCSCKTEQNDCAATRDCHWCPDQGTCNHVTECCNSTASLNTCCVESPFTELPSCLSRICLTGTEPPRSPCFSSDSSSGQDNTASIVGGVLGALLVLMLVLIVTVFFLWAKYCKKGLYEDEQKENAFDFSKSKINAKNPIVNDSEAAKDVEATNNAEASQSSEKQQGNNSSQNLTGGGGDQTTF